MKLTVLGNNGPFPSAGGACSGYLIRHNGINILVDCGNGVLANLQRFIRIEELDAIILTHLHSDHISDIHILKYAIQIKRKRGQMDKLLEVYAPQEPEEEYKRLDVKDAFILKPITADTVLKIGDIKLSFAQMKHPVLDFAISMEFKSMEFKSMEHNRKKFVFSGDTSWNEAIIDLAGGADLLMLDAGLLERDFTVGAAHLTAFQCGEIALKAGVKRLLLTHLWPEYEVGELLEEAHRSFRNAYAAQLLQDYEV